METEINMTTAIEMTKEAMEVDEHNLFTEMEFIYAVKRILGEMKERKFFDENKTWKAEMQVTIKWTDEDK